MPIKRIEKLDQHSFWGLWEITEGFEGLKKGLNLSKTDDSFLNNIKHPEKKLEWLAGRLCIKSLAERQGINYICLKKDPFGKPYLLHEEAEVSISHSYPFVAAILSTQKPVGIDLERPKGKLLSIAHKFLNDREKEHAGNDLSKLCLYWSAKETLYKIYGKKKLIFKEDMEVLPFELQEEGIVNGNILVKGQVAPYTLKYYLNTDFLVVFNI